MPSLSFAQQLLEGTISDENGTPIPYAKIYVKNSAELRTIADLQGYYEMRLYQGEYFLVITSMGYQNIEAYITIEENTVQKNYQLYPTSIQEIENVDVSTKKTNPGRDIMLEVVKIRDQINPWNYPHTVSGYTKASEKIDRKEKEKKNQKDSEKIDPKGIEDPFAEKRKEDESLGQQDEPELKSTSHVTMAEGIK